MIPLDLVSVDALESLANNAQQHTQSGQLPTYIPALGQANPDGFSVHLLTITGQAIQVGDRPLPFALMSVMKPFILLYALEQVGAESVLRSVGIQPSDHAYNSLAQLEADRGFPRNPMINSGAIALCSRLPGATPHERCHRLCQWLNDQAQTRLTLDETILASVRDRPNEQNQAIARYLDVTDHLATSAAEALDLYEQLCCLSGTVSDLAQLGLLLVAGAIAPRHRQLVTALMMTCGLYQYSGRFAVEVGLPAKSGVSGAVLALVPRQGAIACYSPPLDAIGNSAASIWFLRQLAAQADLNVFG